MTNAPAIPPGSLFVSIGSGLASELPGPVRRAGFIYLVTESAHPLVSDQERALYGYGTYSARYGEVLTSRQLLQLLRRCLGAMTPQADVWESENRFVDALRPSIQPHGFATLQELVIDRVQHLEAVRRAFERMDVLVFAARDAGGWVSKTDGVIYPVCPWQVVEGVDRDAYEFVDLSADDIVRDMTEFSQKLRRINDRAIVLLAVTSPPAAEDTCRRFQYERTLDEAFTRLESDTSLTYVRDRDPDGVVDVLGRLRIGTSSDVSARANVGVAATVARERMVDLDRDSTEHESFLSRMQATVELVCDEDFHQETIKCLIWDLDDTLWDGVLVEGDEVQLRPEAHALLRSLDSRGILQSIASRTDREFAMAKLEELGVAEYFVYPQISWSSKSSAIRRIMAFLKLTPSTTAFVDDQAFERDEVADAIPGVACFDADQVARLASTPRFNPPFVSQDAKMRRAMVRAEAERQEDQQSFVGTSGEFLQGLKLVLSIRPQDEGDLERARELMHRTHRLNSTGRRYDRSESEALQKSQSHSVLMANLSDRYGMYGQIGMCVLEHERESWTISLLLVSCRVLSRNAASVLARFLGNLAIEAGVRLRAEFVSTDHNQPMRRSLFDAGFTEVPQEGRRSIFTFGTTALPIPAYMRIEAPGVSEYLTRNDDSSLAECHGDAEGRRGRAW